MSTADAIGYHLSACDSRCFSCKFTSPLLAGICCFVLRWRSQPLVRLSDPPQVPEQDFDPKAARPQSPNGGRREMTLSIPQSPNVVIFKSSKLDMYIFVCWGSKLRFFSLTPNETRVEDSKAQQAFFSCWSWPYNFISTPSLPSPNSNCYSFLHKEPSSSHLGCLSEAWGCISFLWPPIPTPNRIGNLCRGQGWQREVWVGGERLGRERRFLAGCCVTHKDYQTSFLI